MLEQCLLRRILGEIDVAQDPVRDGEEPVAHADSKERECLFVALLRPGHETRIHHFRRCGARLDALSQGYGGREPRTVQFLLTAYEAGRSPRRDLAQTWMPDESRCTIRTS